MRLSELEQLNEDLSTEDEFNNDLENLLFAAYANDLTKISTKSVAKQMITMGYQTSLSHIANVAETIPIVAHASVSTISIGEDMVDDMADEQESKEEESEVSDMAKKSAMDNLEN